MRGTLRCRKRPDGMPGSIRIRTNTVLQQHWFRLCVLSRQFIGNWKGGSQRLYTPQKLPQPSPASRHRMRRVSQLQRLGDESLSSALLVGTDCEGFRDLLFDHAYSLASSGGSVVILAHREAFGRRPPRPIVPAEDDVETVGGHYCDSEVAHQIGLKYISDVDEIAKYFCHLHEAALGACGDDPPAHIVLDLAFGFRAPLADQGSPVLQSDDSADQRCAKLLYAVASAANYLEGERALWLENGASGLEPSLTIGLPGKDARMRYICQRYCGRVVHCELKQAAEGTGQPGIAQVVLRRDSDHGLPAPTRYYEPVEVRSKEGVLASAAVLLREVAGAEDPC
eukprot:scaffold1724_cov246-Pinguiococcus_pyrenoidosus.AAC.8